MNQRKKLSLVSNVHLSVHDRRSAMKNNPNQVIRHTIRGYYKNQNWDALLKYLLLLEERKQLPQSWRWQIGQLYIYNNESSRGLDYLYNLHRQDPQHPDVQLTIFDALRSMGKSEYSFNWIKKPQIKTIDRNILQTCFNEIRQKKNAIPLFILYAVLKELHSEIFDEFDLLFGLKKDNRFSVFNDTCFFRFSKIDIRVEVEILRHAA